MLVGMLLIGPDILNLPYPSRTVGEWHVAKFAHILVLVHVHVHCWRIAVAVVVVVVVVVVDDGNEVF